jgi:hypothetical protein
MLNVALQPYPALGSASRVGGVVGPRDRLTTRELAILLIAGALATLAVATLSMGLQVPGSSILRAALPIILGVALVPRRLAGSVTAVGAALTSITLMATGLAALQPASLTSLLALGPAIDLALARGVRGGPWLYLRFGSAGLVANTLAFFVRAGASWLALEAARPHSNSRFGLGVFLSFAACGIVAGLVSAIVCFRWSSRTD